MSGSLLLDWTFASLLKVSGSEMNDFLRAREDLRRSIYRQRGVADAIDRFADFGVWAKLFCAPELCRSLRRPGSAAEAAASRRLLLSLLQGEAPTLQQKLNEAIRDAGAGSSGTEVKRSLTACADDWLMLDDSREASHGLDYSAVEIFAAPAILLALSAEISRDGAQTKDASLAELGARALGGRYGRFAFILALDWATNSHALFDDEDIDKALLTIPAAEVLNAPDLLARWLRWTFRREHGTSNPAQVIAALQGELVGLSWFRRYFGAPHRARLALVCWQNAVAELMIDTDPFVAVDALAAAWMPRVEVAGRPASVAVPVPSTPELASLLNELYVSPKGRPSGHLTLLSHNEATLGQAWQVLSPYLAEPSWNHQQSPDRLRWLCGLAIDIRVLEVSRHGPAATPFVVHLLSSFGVLRGFGNFSGASWRGWSAGVTPFGNLGWFGRQTWVSALNTLSGFGATTIVDVLEALEEACAGPEAWPLLSSIDVSPALLADLRLQAANGALRLLEEAIGASAAAQASPWIAEAERLLALWEAASLQRLEAPEPAPDGGAANSGRDELSETLHGLLRRYLVKDSKSEDYLDQRVLGELRGRNSEQGIAARRILLAPVGSALEWAPLKPEALRDDTARLALSLMRVTAAHADPSLSRDVAALWRKDLGRTLQEITESRHFDRFARLKLTHMIRDGVFDNDPELLLIVLKTLLEFGGLFHVEGVKRAIMEREFPKVSEIRSALFLVLTRRTAAQLDTRDVEPSPKDEALEQLRATCFFSDEETHGYVASEAQAWARQGWDPAYDVILADAEARAPFSYTDITPAKHPEWNCAATADLVVIDAADGRATLLHRPRKTSADLNAFAGTIRAGPQRYLGVVEGVRRNPHEVEVRFAPERTVAIPSFSAEPPRVGELVLVDAADVEPQRAVQDVAGAETATRFSAEADHDDQASVSFSLDQNGGPVVTARTATGRRLDWNRRTFNLAALFNGNGRPSYAVPTTPRPGGDLAPRTRRFTDLLIEHPSLWDGGHKTFALHGVEFSDAGVLKEVTFEARPFERYRVNTDLSFTAQSAARLAEELRRLRGFGIDARGLLLTVQVTRSPSGPELELVNSVGGADDAEYPALETPYDHRNLVWAERFSGKAEDLTHGACAQADGALLHAEHQTPLLFVTDLPAPPGFPARIAVKLHERCIDPMRFVEIEPETWDPWRVRVEGSVVDEQRLYLSNHEPTRAAELRSLATMAAGDRVVLRDVSRSIRDDGRVTAYTDKNLRVLVNSESLTLKVPCDPTGQWRRGREALLSEVEWRATVFEAGLDPSDVPQKAIAEGRARGLITSVTPQEGSLVACGLAWLGADDEVVTETALKLDVKRSRRPISPGGRLEVSLAQGPLRARIFEPFLMANALWRQGESSLDPASADASFVGVVLQGGQAWDLHETGWGEFALLAAADRPSARNALRRQFALTGDQEDVAALDLTRDDRGIWRGDTRRCALDLGQRRLLAGATACDIIAGPARLLGIQLSLRAALGKPGWLIERRLQILPDQQRPTERPAADAARRETPALAVGDIVYGRYDPAASVLHLSGELHRRYPEGFWIPASAVQRGPVVGGARYSGTGAVARVIALDPPTGSFTAAPESSFEEFATEIQIAQAQGGSLDIDPNLLRLVYVGEEADSAPGATSSGRHLFEWGFGRWLGLSESQLRYRGGPISNAKLLLFYGDRIASAEISEATLSIEGIAPSRAHALYRHRRDHRVINLLRVSLDADGNPLVDAVTGFDPDDAGRQAISGSISHATLDAEGVQRVKGRLRAGGSQKLLGRLDTELFEQSSGRSLVFRYCRLDRQDKDFGAQTGDRIFVAAGSIVELSNKNELSNDVALQVHHPGLDPADVGAEFKSLRHPVRILRRAFSIRQQALWDVLEFRGRAALEDNLLLVRLDSRGPSLTRGAIPRNPEVVRQKLRRGEEIFAVLEDSRSANDLKLELSPGIFVSLPRSALRFSEPVHSGDVLVMRWGGDGKILLSVASPSDSRFAIPGRPAVVLPRDNLARRPFCPPFENPSTLGIAANAFSAGDFPDLALSMRRERRDGVLAQVNDATLVDFMTRPHPKVGTFREPVSGNSDTEVCFVPGLEDDKIVGRLICSRPTVDLPPQVSVGDLLSDAMTYPTDWFLLSASDVSAAELHDLAVRGQRRFHDRLTTTWKRERDGRISPDTSELRPTTAGAGPLFFTLGGDGRASLRPTAALRTVACGPAGLASLLSPRGGAARPIEATIAGLIGNRLFLEIQLGYVVEAPVGMLRFETLAGLRPMSEIDIDLLAVGDRLTLSLGERSDPLKPIVLTVSWTQGPRNGFGASGAYLCRDPETSKPEIGLAVYGSGQICVGLPANQVDELPRAAIVGGAGIFGAAAARAQQLRGCTVLLELDGDSVRVHGHPDATFTPSDTWAWDRDLLFRQVVELGSSSLRFRDKELAERLRLAGGSLPFTVDSVLSEAPLSLALSRRSQDVTPLDGKVFKAVPEGLLADVRQMQLRVGGRHFAVPCETILPGVPDELESTVLGALGRARRPVWLRGRRPGFAGGYADDDGQILIVATREIVVDNERFLGVICEGLSDGRLYWLPEAESAAHHYSASEAMAIFSKMARLKVARLRNRTISILRHPSAAADLERLRPGGAAFVDRLDVDLERPEWMAPYMARDWRLCACVSKQSSLSFALAGPRQSLEASSLHVEVAARVAPGAGCEILAAPADERRVVTEAPPWLIGGGRPPWREANVRFLEPSPPIEALGALVEDPSAYPLDSARAVEMASAFIGARWVGLLSGIALCSALRRSDRGHDQIMSQLVRNLFQRAVRSLPLEALAVWTLRRPPEASNFTLRRYENSLRLLRAGKLNEARESLERWLAAIDLERPNPEEEALANAVGALVGRTANLPGLLTEARFLPKVVEATRPIALSRDVSEPMIDTVVTRLLEVAADLRSRQLDIPLFPPLVAARPRPLRPVRPPRSRPEFRSVTPKQRA